MILHQAIRYEERGTAVSRSKTERRAKLMIRELRRLGYRVEPMAASGRFLVEWSSGALDFHIQNYDRQADGTEFPLLDLGVEPVRELFC